MMDIIETINSLSDLLSLKSATVQQITDAELQLKLIFADEYKKYLGTFGSIMADGIELSGIAKAEYRNVISLTKKAWELNPKVPHSMYVVENTGVDGIIIWQDKNGKIFETRPNAEPKQIADSLSEYIINHKNRE